MNEGKRYLEKETYKVKELSRLKNNVERNYDTTSHITPTWREKENKGWNENKTKKDWKDKKTTARNKGKDTEKRTEHQLETEQLTLEEKQMKFAMEERITIKCLKLEQKKLETEEKINTIKERDKLNLNLPKLDLKKFDGNILK